MLNPKLGCVHTWQHGLGDGHRGPGFSRDGAVIGSPACGGPSLGGRFPSQPVLRQVTLTKPCAPIVTFGIKHSDYMTPLIVHVE